MSRYLVTGATGFLGRHLVAQLLAAGHAVVALVRQRTDELGAAQLREGDVLDAASVTHAAAGCDGVFHLAGKVSRDPRDAESLQRVHVLGTRHVLSAARSAGVRRVVVSSSSGTVGISEDADFIADESSPTPLGLIQRFPYYRSKLHQEEEALAESDAALEVVSINPSLLLGPGDVHGSSTRDVWLFLTRAVPAIPAGGIAYVDARDAAQGAILAMEKGRPGQRYLLNGSNVTVREFFARLSRLSGVAGPRLPLPRSRLFAVKANDLLSRVVGSIGGELAVDAPTVEMGQLFWYVDSGRAERELGFVARDASVTLADTIRDLNRRPQTPALAWYNPRETPMLRPTPEQLATLSPMERVAFTVADRSNRWPLLKRVGQAYLRTIGRSWVHHCTKNLLHVYGRENLQAITPDRGVMLVSNHRSFFDMYVIAAMLFRSVDWVESLYFPVRSDYFYDRPDGILVNGVMSAMAMYPPILRDPKKRLFNQYSVDLLGEITRQRGTVVGMHPEGTRNKGDDPYKLLPLRLGSGQLAHEAKAIVVPMFTLGLINDFPRQVKGNFDGTGEPVTLVIGKPVELDALYAQPGNLKTYHRITKLLGQEITALGQEEKAIRLREGFPCKEPPVSEVPEAQTSTKKRSVA